MRTWIAATAAAVLLVGCGTAAAKPVTARPRSQTVAASAVPLRARALALAWRLVDELSPPPGTRTVPLDLANHPAQRLIRRRPVPRPHHRHCRPPDAREPNACSIA